MPILKSAIKSIRKTKKQTLVNRARKSTFKSVLKHMNGIISQGKKQEALKFFPKFTSQLMKIGKTGVMNKKTAARKISRIAKKINKLKNGS